MSKNNSRKKPKSEFSTEKIKQPRVGVSYSTNNQKPVWQFSLIDIEGVNGWKNVSNKNWWEKILPSLQNREQMTWQQIISESGGKSVGNGTNNHNIPIEKLSPSARKRLFELGYKDIYELFSLRVSGKERIFGLRQDNILKIIWYDSEHTICAAKKN